MFQAESKYALAIRNGPGKSIAGRIIELPEERVFYRFCPDPAKGFSLDSRVAWYVVCRPELKEIHFGTASVLYTIPVREFWLQAAYISLRHTLEVAQNLWQKMSPWYEAGPTREERTASEHVPAPEPLCRATSANHLKPHVPVAGVYDGRPRLSCVFCGCWLEEEKK